MATRKSTAKRKPNIGAPTPKGDSPTAAAGVDDLSMDTRTAIENAVDGLYRIWRLSERTSNELEDCNIDGRIFLEHIGTLCFRHGRALDEIYRRLNPGVKIGCFDEYGDVSDFESPLGSRSAEVAANG